MTRKLTPAELVRRLVIYYALLLAAVAGLLLVDANALQYLPFGGIDALESTDVEITETSVRLDRDLFDSSGRSVLATPGDIGKMSLLLIATLLTTILVMLPVTWTYTATRYDDGASKVFARSLILMPICATTVVLLIQDSLSLAFGLAALVAAVRFRVTLDETIDGIYVFTAICVGLAGGIGYMGVAVVLTMVFTLTHAILWRIDFGSNPVDEARQAARAAKLLGKAKKG